MRGRILRQAQDEEDVGISLNLMLSLSKQHALPSRSMSGKRSNPLQTQNFVPRGRKPVAGIHQIGVTMMAGVSITASRGARDMAGSVNKVILIGNLGADPESRSLSNGSPVVNLRVATSERWTDKASGEKRERTEWHRVVIFDERLCDVASKYLHKGSSVYLEGQLRTNKWTDQQGVEKYTTEVVLTRFNSTLQMLDSRGEGGGGGYGGGGGGGGAQSGGDYGGDRDGGAAPGAGGDLDDDIPF